MSRLNVLVLYDANSTHAQTTYEYLCSFNLYSQHNIFYARATNNAECRFNLNSFDVVVFHYSVRLSLTWHLSPYYKKVLESYKGYKILFIQDEYETTETVRWWIEKLQINAVFTCIPRDYIGVVFPPKRFSTVEFEQVLTGYVPIDHDKFNSYYKPFSSRTNIIGYRGRKLPYWYGDLGQEKLTIAVKMREICLNKAIVADIEWDDNKRIYGEAWYDFLSNCKATLGTETAANIFDDYGEIKKAVEGEIHSNPSISYQEVFDKHLFAHEGKIRMNQISPRIFEAISLRTALVLFEGEYSGVIFAHTHYIPLKKDFSNINEVLAKLEDDQYLETITERAYRDVIASGRYSYQNFIEKFDAFVTSKVCGKSTSKLISFLVIPSMGSENNFIQPTPLHNLPTSMPLQIDTIKILEPLMLINPRYINEILKIELNKLFCKLRAEFIVQIKNCIRFIMPRKIIVWLKKLNAIALENSSK